MNAGVYRIRHTTSGKSYIGSSITLRTRWSVHRKQLDSKSHGNIKLQRAWTKYGANAFIFEMLLYCDPQNCLMYEQIALDVFKPEYNICQKAGSTLGRKLKESTKQKMRGTRDCIKGEKHPMSKLTDQQRSQIKQLGKQGISQRKRAKMFGIGQATVYDIDHTWIVS